MEKVFRIPMQFFAEGSAEPVQNEPSAEPVKNEPLAQPEDDEPMQERTYSEAEYSAILDELKRLRAEHLTQDELHRIELTQRETDIANREAALRDKENRLHAVNALESAGLCIAGITTADLIPFVMDRTTAGIDGKVKALQSLFDKREKAQTEQFYQSAGRQPQQIRNEGSGTDERLFNSALVKAQNRAKEIRERYTGGKK